MQFSGPEPTSHNFWSNSSFRRIEQMLSENVDWKRMQKTRSEKLGISDSSYRNLDRQRQAGRKSISHPNSDASFITSMHSGPITFHCEKPTGSFDCPPRSLDTLTVQVCQEIWHFPCLWKIDCAFQFFPVHLTVLSGKTKAKCLFFF